MVILIAVRSSECFVVIQYLFKVYHAVGIEVIQVKNSVFLAFLLLNGNIVNLQLSK